MQIIATKYFKPKETIASGNYPELATFPVEKKIIENVNYAMQCADKVREKLNKPMVILSWYRNFMLNKAVGGAKNSDHQYGLALDFYTKTPKETAKLIKSFNFNFISKIIYYTNKNFVHLSFSKTPVVSRIWEDNSGSKS